MFRQSLLRGIDAPDTTITDLHAEDLYLAQACAAGNTQALESFDRELLAQVPRFLARHPARAHADEVRQILRERLLVGVDGAPPRIATYSGRGLLTSWVRVAALRTASNLLRADRPHHELSDRLPTGELPELPELQVLEGRYREVFRDAFRTAFAALESEERTMLKLHFFDGVTVRKLVPILGVSSATAGRRLLAAQRRLRRLVFEQLSAAVETPAAELESIVRVLVSRLEVSMSALLQ